MALAYIEKKSVLMKLQQVSHELGFGLQHWKIPYETLVILVPQPGANLLYATEGSSPRLPNT